MFLGSPKKKKKKAYNHLITFFFFFKCMPMPLTRGTAGHDMTPECCKNCPVSWKFILEKPIQYISYCFTMFV